MSGHYPDLVAGGETLNQATLSAYFPPVLEEGVHNFVRYIRHVTTETDPTSDLAVAAKKPKRD